MKTLKLSALMLAAVLFLGLGATTAVASETKGMTLDAKSLNLKTCQGLQNCKCTECKCDKSDSKTCTCEKCNCSSKGSKKGVMKCGPGKCGAANTPPNKVMKCGPGKCGSN